jgi:hypothetical protein
LLTANGNRKQKFVFHGWQTIKSNQQLLFQQAGLDMDTAENWKTGRLEDVNLWHLLLDASTEIFEVKLRGFSPAGL